MENQMVVDMQKRNEQPDIKVYECSNCTKTLEGKVLIGIDKPIEDKVFCDHECKDEYLAEFVEFEEIQV